MEAADIIQALEREFATLKGRFGVKSLGLFGSIARGDVLKGSLKPALRERILREVRNVA
jgi:predicted nucleotidyltransferase